MIAHLLERLFGPPRFEPRYEATFEALPEPPPRRVPPDPPPDDDAIDDVRARLAAHMHLPDGTLAARYPADVRLLLDEIDALRYEVARMRREGLP